MKELNWREDDMATTHIPHPTLVRRGRVTERREYRDVVISGAAVVVPLFSDIVFWHMLGGK